MFIRLLLKLLAAPLDILANAANGIAAREGANRAAEEQ